MKKRVDQLLGLWSIVKYGVNPAAKVRLPHGLTRRKANETSQEVDVLSHCTELQYTVPASAVGAYRNATALVLAKVRPGRTGVRD